MIYIKNITKTYNKETVLEIDYLEIKPGQTFGLVGNNGACLLYTSDAADD